ncbi:MAG: alpha/beta fold hydrolase [Pseudomonadota bacterium]
MAPARGLTAFGLVAALTACTAGGPLDAPTPLGVAQISLDMVEGGETELALSSWPSAGPPELVILGLHGFGDYGPSTFGTAAELWAEENIQVYAYDQRGFGRNASWQRWPGAEALVSDLEATAKAIRGLHPDIPLIVVGHSMGGGVTLIAAGEGRLDADGAILLAPAVWGLDTLPPLYRAGAWFAAVTWPERRWDGQGVAEIWPTDNIELLRRLAADPIQFGNPSSREFVGLIRLMDRAMQAAPRAEMPIVFIHGSNDEVIPEKAARRAYDAVTAPKTFVEIETGWHMLLRDLEAEVVWREVADQARNIANGEGP